MSDTSTNTPGADPSAPPPAMVTHADLHAAVRAATASLASKADLDDAVSQALSGAAPAGEIEQGMAAIGRRLSQIEHSLGLVAPFVEGALTAGTPMIDAAVPAIAPLLARLPAIEAAVSKALSALSAHFGPDKIPGLPTGIAPIAAPVPVP